MDALPAFQIAIQRAENLLHLYDVLKNTRQRSGRSDWKDNFRSFMRWPASKKFIRIDGKDSLIIIMESSAIDHEHFSHDYLSELLRFSLVSSVSAQDRYFHDVIVSQSWKMLGWAENTIPKKLKDLGVPAVEVRRALDNLRRDGGARPGNRIKGIISEKLHKECTFQNVNSLSEAAKGYLGVSDFWRGLASRIRPRMQAEEIKDELNRICYRRNQIVHESDVIRGVRNRGWRLRDINRDEAHEAVKFVKSLVLAADDVFNDGLIS